MTSPTAGPTEAPEDHLTSPAARRFVSALRAVEDDGDVEPMADTASDTTRWWGVGGGDERSGPDGARRFWEAYRRAYADITTTFTAVTESSGRVVLEWESRGHHHNGSPVRYDGVTVLELTEPTADETVAAVRLYFDTTAAASSASRDAGTTDDGSMLDRESEASGESSGLAST